MRKPIPLMMPSCSDKEIAYITETLKTGWWGIGPKTEEFEKKFAEKVGAKYAIGLNNATAGLHLSLLAYNITGSNILAPVTQVIVPAFTFISTALAATYNGCDIVFADIHEDTLCIDWEDVERKTTPFTKAVIAVHFAGKNALERGYEEYKQKHPNVMIIEDAAHAVGTKGVATNVSIWSFHAVKNLSTGDGGMITTNDEEVYQRLLPLRWVGINRTTWERARKKYGWDYDIEEVGYKYHMNDLTASLGLAQIERVDELNSIRLDLVKRYCGALADISWLQTPTWFDTDTIKDSSWHMFQIRIDASERDKFLDHMLAAGISVGVHYKPLYYYNIFPQTPLPVTEKVWKTIVTLPLYPDMTTEEFDYIISTIKSFK